jgi:DNA invertase Pin-like site-specific DNA recombinase
MRLLHWNNHNPSNRLSRQKTNRAALQQMQTNKVKQLTKGDNIMAKIATIKISLVKEANNIPNEQIEQEIKSHLNQFLNGLPWQENAKNVKVAEAHTKKKQNADLQVFSLDTIHVEH